MVSEKLGFAGLRVQKAKEITDFGLCIALYGPPGTGKTVTAAKLSLVEETSPVLIVDAEGGMKSIQHLDVDVVSVKSWDEIYKLSQALIRERPWKTVIWDNLSEFANLALLKYAGSDPPQIQHHGRATLDMLAFTRLARDLARNNNMNSILIAWDAPEKDEFTGVLKRDVGFTPSLARQFPGMVDIVGHLSTENDAAATRHLSFKTSPRSAAKFRRSRIKSALDIPLDMWFGEDDNLLADIILALKGVKEFPKTKYGKPARSA